MLSSTTQQINKPHAPGENPWSLGRAMATTWCRIVLEDAALKLMVFCSLEAAWRRSVLLQMALYLRRAFSGKACFVFCILGVFLCGPTIECLGLCVGGGDEVS
jgi:hypothetical protein